MTVLITGARGNVGRHVVEGLVEAGAQVRAGGRDPASVRVPEGVETVPVELRDPATLPTALAGVRAVFLYTEPQGIGGFVEAAKAAGVEHIVLLSSSSVVAPNAERNPIAQRHSAVERPLADSGLPCTFIRPGGFATNALRWSDDIRAHGIVRIPHPEAQVAPIHEKDIAAVAVRMLTDPRRVGAHVTLTGPRSLPQRRQVELIGEAIGRDIGCAELPVEQARGTVPDALLRYLAASNGRPVPVNDVVRDVTGRPARTFAEWAVEHAADFR